MIKGGTGGANTQSGIHYEGRVNLLTRLAQVEDYSVDGNIISFRGHEVARTYPKFDLYKLLASQGINYKDYVSKRLLPDEAIFVPAMNTIYIVEMKFQTGSGSVDEKPQTCDFKKKQYVKLLTPLGVEVEFLYLLNDWFAKPEYKDMLDYVESVGCYYFFEVIPLDKMGLPLPASEVA